MYNNSKESFTRDVDAVVNAANQGVCTGGGVTGALVKAVGGTESWDTLKLKAENISGPVKLALEPNCSYNSPLSICEAVIMPTQEKLQVPYIISAAGPNSSADSAMITMCYPSIIKLADKYKLKTIVCPFISSGIFANGNQAMKTKVINDSIDSAINAMKSSTFVKEFIFIAQPSDTNTISLATAKLQFIR